MNNYFKFETKLDMRKQRTRVFTTSKSLNERFASHKDRCYFTINKRFIPQRIILDAKDRIFFSSQRSNVNARFSEYANAKWVRIQKCDSEEEDIKRLHRNLQIMSKSRRTVILPSGKFKGYIKKSDWTEAGKKYADLRFDQKFRSKSNSKDCDSVPETADSRYKQKLKNKSSCNSVTATADLISDQKLKRKSSSKICNASVPATADYRSDQKFKSNSTSKICNLSVPATADHRSDKKFKSKSSRKIHNSSVPTIEDLLPYQKMNRKSSSKICNASVPATADLRSDQKLKSKSSSKISNASIPVTADFRSDEKLRSMSSSKVSNVNVPVEPEDGRHSNKCETQNSSFKRFRNCENKEMELTKNNDSLRASGSIDRPASGGMDIRPMVNKTDFVNSPFHYVSNDLRCGQQSLYKWKKGPPTKMELDDELDQYMAEMKDSKIPEKDDNDVELFVAEYMMETENSLELVKTIDF